MEPGMVSLHLLQSGAVEEDGRMQSGLEFGAEDPGRGRLLPAGQQPPESGGAGTGRGPGRKVARLGSWAAEVRAGQGHLWKA